MHDSTVELDLDLAMATARRAAEAGARAAMAHFRTDIAVEKKPDRSPVTIADRESEAAILAVIRAAFPTHAILAEESGTHAGDVGARWIVDPLDGTRGFSRGGVFWGPLVALEHQGRIVAGAMALPASGVTYWAARGRGAFRDGHRLALSRIDDLEEATCVLGEMRYLFGPGWGDGVRRLVTTAASTRCPGDLASAAMLLDGRAELWLEAGVQLWDLAPLRILVEEAGGVFTGLDGSDDLGSGHVIAGVPALHGRALAILRG